MTSQTGPIGSGLWPSSITAKQTSTQAQFADVRWSSDGNSLLWIDSGSGQGRLWLKTGIETRELSAGINVRGRLNYGGGEFSEHNGLVLFVSSAGTLYQVNTSTPEHQPQALTPGGCLTASPAISPKEDWAIFALREGEHDCLAAVCLQPDAEKQIIRIASGADFYMDPVWSPDGEQLAWLEWDHPNLPFTGTRLMLASVEKTKTGLKVGKTRQLAGGKDQPILQPAFSPDGRWLSWISCEADRDLLVTVDLSTSTRSHLIDQEGALIVIPAWLQGMRAYAWTADSQGIITILHANGRARLAEIRLADDSQTIVSTTPYTWFSQISVNNRHEIALIASSPLHPACVVYQHGKQWAKAAQDEIEPIALEYLPEPLSLSWKASDGTQIQAWYYPPTHPNFKGSQPPPAIIHLHSGPTRLAALEFDAEPAYFTSRGFAWLKVNYRGSSGFGKKYQDKLKGNWGVVDVEDAAGAARALVDGGLADPHRLVLYGSSAGGFTALNALIAYPNLFCAAMLKYPVTDLLTLNEKTHKFERYYNDWLIGQLPGARQEYLERSPSGRADHIQSPVALFHGQDDPVIPVIQAVELAGQIKRNRIPLVFKIYEGEGHGFRKPETQADLYQQMENFLVEQVLKIPS